MRCAYAVLISLSLFQKLELPLQGSVQSNRCAEAAEIVAIANSLDFHPLAIQEESLRAVEGKRSDSKSRRRCGAHHVPRSTVVAARYKTGESTDQSFGFATVRF